MKFNKILTIYKKEIKDTLRDRRTRRLSPDKVGDESGLRSRRVHRRQRHSSRRPRHPRAKIPEPAVRPRRRRDTRSGPRQDSVVCQC